MTFDVLEKTPQVAPLLVRLYDSHNLYALAENSDNEGTCLELATVMIDLLQIKLSDRESELIADVLLSLLKQAEQDLKIALSERLADMDGVPLRIVLGLANDDIVIADPVLKQSPLLQDLDLMYILQSKGVTHGRSIAKRAALSGDVVDMLAETRDLEIAVNLSVNQDTTITKHAYGIFGDMAKHHDDLARPLLLREDVPQEIAGKLYQFVGDELKRVLKHRYGIGGERASIALDEITVEMIDAAPSPDDNYHEDLIAQAHIRQQRDDFKVANIIATLRRGQYSTFLAQFSVYCGVPIMKMRAVLSQDTGRGLAIVCKAKDIQKSEFVSLYLLTQRFRTGTKRMVTHTELGRIMTMYDDIKPDHARRVLAESRH